MINIAIEELVKLIDLQVEECKKRGWDYYATSEGVPESYKALKKFKESKVLPIANYGCDTSIYTEEVNIKFRFWHDVLHLENNKSFSRLGEHSVADLHIQKAVELGLSELAIKILTVDTKMQVDYFFETGDFVSNQKDFVLSNL